VPSVIVGTASPAYTKCLIAWSPWSVLPTRPTSYASPSASPTVENPTPTAAPTRAHSAGGASRPSLHSHEFSWTAVIVERGACCAPLVGWT
jgi:hypothetical protein